MARLETMNTVPNVLIAGDLVFRPDFSYINWTIIIKLLQTDMIFFINFILSLVTFRKRFALIPIGLL